MPGKKPGAKASKPKKPTTAAKPAARRVEARKSERVAAASAPRPTAVASTKPVSTAATAAAVKPVKKVAPPAPPRRIDVIAAPPVRALHADAEEGDASEPGSLLAGPRNVKPYVAKRGEQYMSKEQLNHFQHILLSWKRDLMEEVDRTVSHMKDEAANFPDPNDRATQEEEFSLELRTRDRERKLIRKIDEALKRIEDGTYGYCLETGEEIGIKRLEARPVATLSIEAQERRERRERQYGDRDDRYR
jgi:DnaK suppressor protein